MAWQYDPIGAGWIVGTVPGLADFQHIEDDIHTWGGDVNAGGHQLTNLAGITMSSTGVGVGYNSNALSRFPFVNSNTGSSTRMDIQIGTGLGPLDMYIGVDGGSAYGNGEQAYIDSPSPLLFTAPKVIFPSATGIGIGNNNPTCSGTGKVHFSGDTARIVDASNTPANSAATGNDGEVRMDSSYIYIHSGGSWRRAAVSTF